MILGSPGSGKSTLARQLGVRLGVPVFHLDQLYHLPNWEPSPPEIFHARVAEVSALPGWVIDGNYSSTAEPRLAVADTIIYLHVPRWLAMLRVIRRATLGYGRQRQDVEPRVRAIAEGFRGRVIEIRSREDARRLLIEGTGVVPRPSLHARHDDEDRFE